MARNLLQIASKEAFTLKKFSPELKNKIIQEVKEVGSVASVAKKYEVPVTTVYSWVNKSSKKSGQSESQIDKKKMRSLEKKVSEMELEIEVLKELLKKTNHAWLGK